MPHPASTAKLIQTPQMTASQVNHPPGITGQGAMNPAPGLLRSQVPHECLLNRGGHTARSLCAVTAFGLHITFYACLPQACHKPLSHVRAKQIGLGLGQDRQSQLTRSLCMLLKH